MRENRTLIGAAAAGAVVTALVLWLLLKPIAAAREADSHLAEARGAAEAAFRDWRSWKARRPAGVGEETAGRAATVLARAAELSDSEARDAYAEAETLFRDAAREVREALAKAAKALHAAAFEARASARHAVRELDALREELAARVEAAEGDERVLLELLLEDCDRRVFRAPSRDRVDEILARAEDALERERHEEARKAFADAAERAGALAAAFAGAEPRLRCQKARRRVLVLRGRLYERWEERGLDPPAEVQEAEREFADGVRLLGDREYDLALAALARAERGFAESGRSAEETVAQRLNAEAARATAVEARVESPRGDALLARGDAHRAAGRYVEAAQAYVEADEAFRTASIAAAAGAARTPPPDPPVGIASEDVRDHVKAGLEWLARHQDLPRGCWDAAGFAKHDRPDEACAGPGRPAHDVGVTALALLAFLEAGYTDHGEGPAAHYAAHVRHGLLYLLAEQDRGGCFGSRSAQRYVYGHAIATLVLAEAARRFEDRRYREAAEHGVAYLLAARNRDRSLPPHRRAWRYRPGDGESDTSVTLWCVRALAAGRRAGLRVNERAFQAARRWIDAMTDPETGRVGYLKRGTPSIRDHAARERFPASLTHALTAAGMIVRNVVGAVSDHDREMLRKGALLCLECLPEWDAAGGTIDMYYWHLGTIALADYGGPNWRRWKSFLVPVACGRQAVKDCARGSWDPVGAWGHEGGRVYATALMTLTLLECG